MNITFRSLSLPCLLLASVFVLSGCNSGGAVSAKSSSIGAKSGVGSAKRVGGKSLTARNRTPVARIKADISTGEAPLAVAFDGADSTDPEQRIVGYQWDFGDGIKATGRRITHTYVDEGRFTATLTVTDDQGLTGTATLVIQVTGTAAAKIDSNDAARFLAQATFGPRLEDIERLRRIGYEAWIDDQFALPPTSHLQRVGAQTPGAEGQHGRLDVWWDIAVNGDDQLRQRVAFALSEIMVVSDRANRLEDPADLVTGYYEVLVQHGLGHFRDLLEQVTLNPAMGIYLSMLGNDKPDPETGRRADENYAREVLQLFTIGLVELNQDGTPKLVDGKPVPTYTQADIENLARVFTGWSFDNGGFDKQWVKKGAVVTRPMVPYDEHHDSGEKVVMGTHFPAGQSAREDLAMALDLIANHPNVGPFIGRQLIQRLVTSNPSPEYVARVAAVFNDNGAGERGDMKAVVKAILLDPEARQGHIGRADTFGKLREPLLRVSHLWRAFHAQGGRMPDDPAERYTAFHFHGYSDGFRQQAPLRAPTVFNWFLPDYRPAGVLKDAGLVGPEFQIDTESQLPRMYEALTTLATKDGLDDETVAKLSLDREIGLIATPEKLIDHLNLVLMSGAMSTEMRQVLLDYEQRNREALNEEQRVRNLIALIITSPEYAVQR